MQHATPDRLALECAHRMLRVTTPLDEMLKNATFKIILEAVARRQMQRRSWVDVKKLQANDKE